MQSQTREMTDVSSKNLNLWTWNVQQENSASEKIYMRCILDNSLYVLLEDVKVRNIKIFIYSSLIVTCTPQPTIVFFGHRASEKVSIPKLWAENQEERLACKKGRIIFKPANMHNNQRKLP
jgi:hypothetical protein